MQLNSDCLPGDCTRVHRSRAQSHGTAPTSGAKPGCHLCLWPTDDKEQVPTTPFSGSIDLLGQFTESRIPVYLLDCWFITKDIKGYRWTARGEIHRARFGRVANTGASVPAEFGAQHVDPFWFANLEALWTPPFMGFHGGSTPLIMGGSPGHHTPILGGFPRVTSLTQTPRGRGRLVMDIKTPVSLPGSEGISGTEAKRPNVVKRCSRCS